jgi:hypothetical protein
MFLCILANTMRFSKKGSVNLGGKAMNVVYGFVGIILLLLLAKELLPEAQYALGNISLLTDLPLIGLLSGTGIVMMIIVVVIIIAVIKSAQGVAK